MADDTITSELQPAISRSDNQFQQAKLVYADLRSSARPCHCMHCTAGTSGKGCRSCILHCTVCRRNIQCMLVICMPLLQQWYGMLCRAYGVDFNCIQTFEQHVIAHLTILAQQKHTIHQTRSTSNFRCVTLQTS